MNWFSGFKAACSGQEKKHKFNQYNLQMKRRQGSLPRYYAFRIYFFSTLFYFLLVLPLAGFIAFQNLPDLLERNEMWKQQISDSKPAETSSDIRITIGNRPDNLDKPQKPSPAPESQSYAVENDFDYLPPPETLTEKNKSIHVQSPDQEGLISETFSFLLWLALPIVFILGLIFNLPFKLVIRGLRKGKKRKEKWFDFCKKNLVRSPLINAGILGAAFLAVHIFMIIKYLALPEESSGYGQIFTRFFIISLFSALLSVMFQYSWFKHRIHIKHITTFFTPEELKRRVFKSAGGKIKNRFWLSIAMTTLLPLSIVISYLFMGLTEISKLGLQNISDEHINILLGRYSDMINAAITSNNFLEEFQNLYYVNVIDGLVMLSGIGIGVFVSIIYILLFVKWTTADIVYPVNELIANMQKTGEGKHSSYTIVRSNDEIGLLAERFNIMSAAIEQHVNNIEKMNKAYYRFVPKQFLDFLDKESITEVELGDQVQKEMSVLFTDIRDFTSLSEDMTPKETFDFLNEYLSIMEPLISRNQGFIDKYIGDSIMALFVGQVENAIDAAIEMRIALADFNLKRKFETKPPINSGIGLHTGKLMLGVVGGHGRMDGTVVSDAVNLASRVEGLTKLYGASIIVSQDTLMKLEDPNRYNYRYLDVVKVKGKKEAVHIFEILDGEPGHIRKLKMETKVDFGNAINSYKNKEIDSAMEGFEYISKKNPHDFAAKLYISRCKNIVDFGLPKDWDGVETFRDKF
jgi:class 3 adenylate cyclase